MSLQALNWPSVSILILDFLIYPGPTSVNFSGGIRCGEIGGVMHGKASENLENGNEFEHENRELLRLALPRRTYTESHMKYVQCRGIM